MADSQKTEKATPKRRRDERRKGNIFFSNDAVSVVVLIAGLATLFLSMGSMADNLGQFLRSCISLVRLSQGTDAVGDLRQLLPELLWSFVLTVGPILLVPTVAGIAATFFQTKLLVTGESLRPKFSRINPLQGIKRLFSLRSLIEALKGLLKITVLLYIIYNFLAGTVELFTKYLFTDLVTACSHLAGLAFQMSMQIAVAYVVLAAADVFYQWMDYERQLRMSKQEIKEEFKQIEGDPQVKGRIKEIQRKMAQSRMMQRCPRPTWWCETPPTLPWPCATSRTGTEPRWCWPRDRTRSPCGSCRRRRRAAWQWWRMCLWPEPFTPPRSWDRRSRRSCTARWQKCWYISISCMRTANKRK